MSPNQLAQNQTSPNQIDQKKKIEYLYSVINDKEEEITALKLDLSNKDLAKEREITALKLAHHAKIEAKNKEIALRDKFILDL